MAKEDSKAETLARVESDESKMASVVDKGRGASGRDWVRSGEG